MQNKQIQIDAHSIAAAESNWGFKAFAKGNSAIIDKEGEEHCVFVFSSQIFPHTGLMILTEGQKL